MPLRQFNSRQNILPPRPPSNMKMFGRPTSSALGATMNEWFEFYKSSSQEDETLIQNGQYVQLSRVEYDFSGPRDGWLVGGTIPSDIYNNELKNYINQNYSGGSFQVPTITAGPFEPGRTVTAEVIVDGEIKKTEQVAGTGLRQDIIFDNQVVLAELTTEGSPPTIAVEVRDDGFEHIADLREYFSPLPRPQDMWHSYVNRGGFTNWTGNKGKGKLHAFSSKSFVTDDQITFARGKPNPTLSRPNTGSRAGSGVGTVSADGTGQQGFIYGPVQIKMNPNALLGATLYIEAGTSSRNTSVWVSEDDGPLQPVKFHGTRRETPIRYRVIKNWLVPHPRNSTHSRWTTLLHTGEQSTVYWIVPDTVSPVATRFVNPERPSPLPSNINFVEPDIDYYEVPGRGLSYRKTKSINRNGWGYRYGGGGVTIRVEPSY